MNTIPELLSDLKLGRMIILADDEDRENEGDLIFAADFVSPDKVNFMSQEARGLICLAMSGEQIDRLALPQMVRDELNLSPNKTAFTVSIEASSGVSTGISAHDRAHTIWAASRTTAKPGDVRVPGHIFPIRAQSGGVLKRAGHTEASVDLCRMGGLSSAAVICEIMNPDGTMSRIPQLKEFAARHDIKMGTIADLIQYRLQNETLIQEVASSELPTRFGDFHVRVFRSLVDGSEHIALVRGQVRPDTEVLVRVHSECMTGDVFGSLRCDCGAQLSTALELISREGAGVLLYLRQEGRGIGLANKIKAYALQDQGLDTVDANVHLGFKADHRDYGIGAQILRAVGVSRIKLLTNNPQKRTGLKGYNIEIVDRVPLQVGANPKNEKYLRAKREKLGHLFDVISNSENSL